MGKFQFTKASYGYQLNDCSVNMKKRENNGKKLSELFDERAAKEFTETANEKLPEQLNRMFEDNPIESAGYHVIEWRGGILADFNITANRMMSESELQETEHFVEKYQVGFAEEFNKQPFAKLENGSVRFPKRNPNFKLTINPEIRGSENTEIKEGDIGTYLNYYGG